MIQVIQRSFSILEMLSPDTGVKLEDLTVTTGLNKGTLCNILKSLVELGYVDKGGNGTYLISKKFYALAQPYCQEQRLLDQVKNSLKYFTEATRESGVAAVLNKNSEVEIIAQEQYRRSIMVSREVYQNLSLYHSVTGRILVSYAPEEELQRIIRQHGFPGEQWNNIENLDELRESIRCVRKQKMAVMENRELEIKAFAAPCILADGRCVSIGLTVPLARLDEQSVVSTLRKIQAEISKE